MTGQQQANCNPVHCGISTMDVECRTMGMSLHRDSQTEKIGAKSMMQYVIGNPKLLRFMQMTANFWPQTHDTDLTWLVTHRAYYLLVRIILLFSVGYALYLFGIEVQQGRIVGITISLTFFLDIVSVLPAPYYNQRRLTSSSTARVDDSVSDLCTIVAQRFVCVCFGTIATSICFGTISYPKPMAVVALTISEACVVAYLAFNLWFLLIDLQVSSARIDELLALAECKQLSLARFNAARDDVHRRVRESKWVSDFILLPCVASVISIVVLMFHVKPDLGRIAYTIGWVAALIKEMLFICVAFCFVATVNQKSDELTEKLSCEVWAPIDCEQGIDYNQDSFTSDTHDSNSSGTESASTQLNALHPSSEGSQQAPKKSNAVAQTGPQPSDIERLTMCVSSLTRPISFTLLFKRVSWQNVVVSFAGVALTIGVGLARSLVTQL
jgi:hypothetical protein